MCKCAKWNWATKSACQFCQTAPPKWAKQCSKDAKPNEGGGCGSNVPRNADGQPPTGAADLGEWIVQPRGRRKQAKVRTVAAAAAGDKNDEFSDMEVDGEDAVMVVVDEPTIDALEAELKHLQTAPVTDAVLEPIIVAKTAQIKLRKDALRSSKAGWQQERDLDQKIKRARRNRERLARREAELALEISALQLEGQRICEEGSEVDARIASLEAELAAVARRTAAGAGERCATPLATLSELATANARVQELDAIVNLAVQSMLAIIEHKR